MIQPAGSLVAIFGAGPVGLLSAACARLEGAEQIYMIDHNDYRLMVDHVDLFGTFQAGTGGAE
jgi:threonine dehydrogenase-like Zn-dependent dehydrogenase